MSRAAWMGFVLGLLLIAGIAWWLYGGVQETEDDEPQRVTAVDYGDESDESDESDDAAEDSDAEPPPRYPLLQPTEGEGAEPEPLPELETSDEALRGEVATLEGAAPLEAVLLPERLIERFVATLNSLDSRMAPLRMWPVEHVAGVPEIAREGEGRFRWRAENHSRYDAYVRAFTAPGAETLVDLYIRYYPLLQQAYESLGEREGYFNDRVIALIDHMLDAPEARESYELRQPRVLFTFADEELEALSPGQKLLLRIGPEHSAAVREQLRAIRAEIVARTGGDAAP